MITSIWAGPGGDFAAAKAIRQAVFVEELGMDPALGWDTTDDFSFHLVLLLDGEPVATGRITYGGVGVAALGRICVLKRYRRQGIGDGLVKVLDYRASQLGMQYSAVEATERLEGFYARIGYQPVGEKYLKWGQQLIPMRKPVNDGDSETCHCSCQG